MAGKLSAEHVRQFIAAKKGFDYVLQKVKILTASGGDCVAEMKIEEEHSNPMGGLHGGFSATLVDVLSSYALLTHEKGAVPSVSVDIHLTYAKGARIGDEITVEARTLRTGKTLAFLEVFIKNKRTQELLVKASHTKFFVHPVD